MKEFRIPQRLEDLESADNEFFGVVDMIDLESYDPEQCVELLNNLSNEVVDSRCYDLIVEQSNFDVLYSFVKYFGQLPEEVKAKCVEFILRSGRGFVVSSMNKSISKESFVSAKNSLYIYVYFVSLLIKEMDIIFDSLVDQDKMVTEKGRKVKKRRVINSDIKWGDYLYDSMEVLLFAVRGNLKSFFSMGLPDEIFLQLFSRPCLYLFERSSNQDNPRLIEVDLNILASLLSNYPSSLSAICAMLVGMIVSLDHVSDLIAQLAKILYDRCNGYCELVTELIKEISKLTLVDDVKNLSHFIALCSDQAPFALLRSLPSLLKLLDRESYSLRLAVLQSLGNLLKHTSGVEMAEGRKRVEKASDYQSVVQRRASIVVRRQSMIQGGENEVNEKEKEKEKEKEMRCIDLKTAVAVLELMQERGHDVNAFVRSAALRTMVVVCEEGLIPLSEYGKVTSVALERVRDKAVLVRKNAVSLLCSLIQNNPYESSLQSSVYEAKLKDLIDMKSTSQDDTETSKIDKLIDYYQHALHFSSLITSSVTSVSHLLSSQSEGDILSCLQFFPIAVSFHVPSVQHGLRHMLKLIWGSSPSVTKELIRAIKELYFSPPNEEVDFPPNIVASKLIELLRGATVAETTSFAEIIPHLLGEGVLIDRHIEGLWVYVCSTTVDETAKETALYIIGTIALASSALVMKNPQRLLSLSSCLHSSLYRQIKLIMILWRASITTTVEVKHKITHSITNFIIHSITHPTTDYASLWYPAANEAINALFVLVPRFDLITQSIIQSAGKAIFSSHSHTVTVTVTATVTASQSETITEPQPSSSHVSELSLSRFLFILGQFALKLLQYCESLASRAKKARHNHEEQEKQKQKTIKPRSTLINDDDIGLVTSIDDIEEGIIDQISNYELVIDNLIGHFGCILQDIIINKRNIYGIPLQHSSLLSFCKYMCISRIFCENNLNLLFTLLVRSLDNQIRSMIIICIGDLCYRFPNQLEPWTSVIYQQLTDKSILVRTNALSVLSHLILNDMIRVKGQVALIVLLLEDTSEHIQSLAKVFFIEWSKRGNNPIYNILPECISSLLDMPEINYESFQRLIKFLLRFVEKDKQQDQLIEKCLQRIPLTIDPFKWKCYLTCLNCLRVNAQSVERYLQNKRLLKDALRVNEVNEVMKQIITKMKRSAKPEQQGQIDELLQFVNQCNEEKEREPMSPEIEKTKNITINMMTTPIKDICQEYVVLESQLSAKKRRSHGIGIEEGTIKNVCCNDESIINDYLCL